MIMLTGGTVFSIITILLGAVLAIIAAIALRKPENRQTTWPWVVGIIGIIMFIGNLIGLVLERVGITYDIEERAYDFAARVEETLEPFQRAMSLWSTLVGAVLLIVGIVILRKPENRQKIWPWVIAVIGLIMFILNGFRFLLY